MDLHNVILVLLVVLLQASAAVSTVKECISGFLDTLNAEDYNSRQLSPLLGSFGSSGAEQWIFPSLRFTCFGRLIKWIYRPAFPQVQVSMECRINIATWRLDGSSFGTVYRKLSTTEGVLRSTSDGIIFTYEFTTPVEFQPGDIAGIELSSYTCSLFGGTDNILSVAISGTGLTSQSHRRFGTGSIFRVSQQPLTYIVPFIQPVIETVPLEEPTTIGNAIFTASNAAENNPEPSTGADPMINSEVNEEIRTSETLSATTDDGGSGLVDTESDESRDKLVLIIHIVAGVGIGVLVLLGLIVACIGLVGIMKCMQARMAKGRRSDNIEEPQIIISTSNGTLLQENTAYKKFTTNWSTDKMMLTEESTVSCRNSEWPQDISSSSNGTLLYDNGAYSIVTTTCSWTTDTTGYETLLTDGRRNSDIEQLQQNASNDLAAGYETSTEEQTKPYSTEPQATSNSNTIVVQENTAYKKSTSNRELVAYESTSTEENRGSDSHQCANSSGIEVHKNTAYKKSTSGGDAVAGYETMDEIVEQVMQLNQAYGFQEEEMESVDAGDYETMTGDSMYDYGSQTALRGDTQDDEQATYDDVLIQKQHTSLSLADSEHSYDYII